MGSILRALIPCLRLKLDSRTVHGFWHGETLNALHYACLRSFISNNHPFELFVYEELDVPDGVRLRDAAEVVPRGELFFFQSDQTARPDVAPFSDFFRLRYLYEFGGWWCDVDTICLSTKLPEGNRIWARQAPDYRPDSVSNGQLYFKKGDWVANKLLMACYEAMKNVDRRESLGPELVSRVLADLGLPLDMGATADQLYPIRYIENFKLWLPEFIEEISERLTNAIFLPVYQSFPKRIGFSYNKLPPRGSYLYHFIRDKSPEFPDITHDVNDFRQAVRSWFKVTSKWSVSRLKSVSRPDIEDWLSS